jgi:Tfp pilus assembly protein PilX
MKKIYKQKGVVAIFVVIFAALLMTVVTVSFIRITVQNQQQSSATDLSQSAYDSAQAGVEDAKRAILYYKKVCADGSSPLCNEIASGIKNSETCNAAVATLEDVKAEMISGNGAEVRVQNGTKDNKLDQAYTCVKVTLNTSDFTGDLGVDGSKTIPLRGISMFDEIQIEWFDLNDAARSIKLLYNTPSSPLFAQNTWQVTKNMPPIMRTQLIQFDGTVGFNLKDFDDSAIGSNTNTLFLYPIGKGIDKRSFSLDGRRTTTGSPTQIECSDNFNAVDYSCKAILSLPFPAGGDASTPRVAYLRLTSLYNKTSYRIKLKNSTGGEVKFDGVQPSIDSTGRANDYFRRVRAKVELVSDDYDAAVYTSSKFCKDFMVTDTDNYSKCSP